jgi:hypothetical protein
MKITKISGFEESKISGEVRGMPHFWVKESNPFYKHYLGCDALKKGKTIEVKEKVRPKKSRTK